MLPRPKPQPKILLAAAALLTVLTLASGSLTGVARANAGTRRIGTAPALPRGARRLGALPGTTVLSVDIALKPRRASALAGYARAVSDRASSDYRRYLSVAEVRRRFGPAPAGVAAVRAALTRSGLNAAQISVNGLLIRVTATAARLDAALGVELERVKLADGRVAYVNRRAPRFGLGISGLIQGVVGLDDLVQPESLGLHRAATTRPTADARRSALTAAASPAATPTAACSSSLAENGGYTPDQIASAYGFDSLYDDGDYGAGETVALMEYEQYSSSDIQAFENCFTVGGSALGGGSAADVDEINVDGGAGTSGPGAQYGSGEAALDIEEVLSVAPGATVDVYEAPDSGSDSTTLDAWNEMVESDSVDVISTSWGECENALEETDPSLAAEENAIFEEAAAEGISVFAASGDSGSSGCEGQVSGRQASAASVEDPGSQPYVTSVGGTSLASDTGAAAQTVWNDSLGAGGGGVSQLWTMPSYQTAAASTLPGIISADSSSSACSARSGSYCRETPDVSADADPDTGYAIYWDAGWNVIGGTSAAAPLWAGLTALADDYSTCGDRTVGFTNAVLYGIAANPTEYANDFTDVTSGDNAVSSLLSTLFPATTGYDMASGLGTPRAATLVPDMCAEATALGIGRRTTAGTNSAPVATTPTTTAATTTPAAATSTPAAPASPASETTTATSTTPACALTAMLAEGSHTLTLNHAHPSAALSLSFTEPAVAGCTRDVLTLTRHITTTERAAARRRDTLKVELLSSSGKLLKTLATMSGANARSGYQTVTLDLSAYRGRAVTLRFLATRGGARTTAFTLRSLALSLS